MRKIHPVLVFVAAFFVSAVTAQPQSAFQVFLQRDVDFNGLDRLQFVDTLTGEGISLDVNGSDYTLLHNGVLYFDSVAQQVQVALPSGEIRRHPFIRPTGAYRVDWAVSHDRKKIAWTLTEASEANALTTTTYVADVDGTNRRRVLVDGPRDGIRVLPLAFGADNTVLYMDYQPDALADITPFQQYAGVFALNIDSGQIQMLPGEPGCYCGAGLGAGTFIRLELAENLSGFDVALHNLTAGTNMVIPALNLRNYTQAGDILISPDGTRAVYTLAQVRDFGGPGQFVRTVLALVNVTDGTQMTLTDSLSAFVQPVSWTEDNSAVIVVNPFQNSTWKVDVNDGRLTQIANAVYLGSLSP